MQSPDAVAVLRKIADARRSEDGQDLLEYGLLAALIAVIAIGAVRRWGTPSTPSSGKSLPPTFNPAFAALVAGVLVASVTDIRTRRIPNEVTAAMATLGVGFAAMGYSGLSVWASLAGLASASRS